MRYEDLSPADQKLLNTDLGDFEKEAAEQVSLANEMYSVGFNKLAGETADYLDSLTEKQASVEETALDAESEKVATDLSAFIERGYFDGLRKEGAERHEDENYYLRHFVEEKVAAAGAEGAVAKFLGKVKGHTGAVVDKAKGVAGKAWGATKETSGKAWGAAKAAPGKAKEGVKSYHAGAQADIAKGKGLFGEGRKLEGAKHVAKGVGKHVAPYGAAAGAAGAAYGAKKLYDKKKD